MRTDCIEAHVCRNDKRFGGVHNEGLKRPAGAFHYRFLPLNKIEDIYRAVSSMGRCPC